MRIKNWFSKENIRRPVFWVSLVGVLSIVLLVVGLAWWVADQPRFCVSCHIEKGAYDTWTQSTHSRVSCNLCHVKPGFLSALEFRFALFRLAYVTVTKDPSKPTEVTLPANENCDQCHKVKRTISPSGDLKIPHQSHVKLRKLRCVDCHRNMVHSVNPTKRNRPPMIACYKCHDGKRAPNRCDACHTEKGVPDDHKAADWLMTHSDKQKQDPQYCVKCHGWVKDYCSECHQRRPRSHATKWRTNHQVKIASFGKGGCMHCHQDAMCIRCHGQVP